MKKPAKAPPPEPTRPRHHRAIGWAMAALGALLYLNTLGHGYCLDDHDTITQNKLVKGGVKNLGTLFTTEYRAGARTTPGSLYRPLPLAMFALEWELWPNRPFVGHLVNLLLYALTGFLLWVTWRRLLKDQPPLVPIAAVVLFLAHPVHTEVVANIKSLDEILALLFATLGLLGLWRYLERAGKIHLIGALLAFGLALLSKESAITFLAIYPLAIWFFTDRTLAANLRVSALFLIPAALYLVARHLVLTAQGATEQVSVLDNFLVAAPDLLTRLTSALAVCSHYLQVLVFPHPLVCDHGYPHFALVGPSSLRAWLGLVALGVPLGWALLHLRRKHVLAFAILFFLVTFAPASNLFVLVGTSFGERLLYTPSFGFALALAWAIGALSKAAETRWGWRPGRARAWVWGLLIVVVGLYGLGTVTRNPAWRDDLTLYAEDLPRVPNSAKLNYLHGLALTHPELRGRPDAAPDEADYRRSIEAFSETLRLDPGFEDAYANRGTSYFFLHDYDRARVDFERALQLRPDDPLVLTNLGTLHFLQKDLPRAEEIFRRAIRANPASVEDRYNLGTVLSSTGRLEEAIEQWKAVVRLDPSNPRPFQKIGAAYRELGQPEQAREWLGQAAARGAAPGP